VLTLKAAGLVDIDADEIVGSARELTREAGALLIKERSAPRVVNLLWLSRLTSGSRTACSGQTLGRGARRSS